MLSFSVFLPHSLPRLQCRHNVDANADVECWSYKRKKNTIAKQCNNKNILCFVYRHTHTHILIYMNNVKFIWFPCTKIVIQQIKSMIIKESGKDIPIHHNVKPYQPSIREREREKAIARECIFVFNFKGEVNVLTLYYTINYQIHSNRSVERATEKKKRRNGNISRMRRRNNQQWNECNKRIAS